MVGIIKHFREEIKTSIEILRERELLIHNLFVLCSGLALGALLLFSIVYTKIDFTYRPDTLGIISIVTIYEYPNQMKSILYVAGVSSLMVSAVVIWLIWVFIASLYATMTNKNPKDLLKLSIFSGIPIFISLLNTLPDAEKGLKAAKTAAFEAILIYILIAITCYIKQKSIEDYGNNTRDNGFIVTVILGGLSLGFFFHLASITGVKIPLLGASYLLLGPIFSYLWWIVFTFYLYKAKGKRQWGDGEDSSAYSALTFVPLFLMPLYILAFRYNGMFQVFLAFPLVLVILLQACLILRGKKSGVRSQESEVREQITEHRIQNIYHGLGTEIEPLARLNRGFWDYLLAPVVIMVLIYDPNFLHWIKPDYTFFGEEGQHLAWVHRILHGQFPNKDMFNLYGPLYEYGYAAFMKLFGVNLASFRTCGLIYEFISLFCLYIFLRITFRSRLFAILTFLVIYQNIWFQLRIGLGFLSLAFLFAFLKEDIPRKGLLYLAGFVTGISLLYSQEIGISTFIATTTALTIATVSKRFNVGYQSFLAYGAGITTILVPFAIYYGINGALVKAVSTMVEYPRYLMAGYGALPYPTIIRSIPEGFSFKVYIESIFNIFGTFLYFYAPGLYAVVGSYLAIKIFLRRWNKDEMLLSTLLIFGIFSFNSALGRADVGHIKYAMPASVLLFFIIIEKIFLVVKEEIARVDSPVKNRALLTVFVPVLLIIGYVYGLSAIVSAADGLYSKYKGGYGRLPEAYVQSNIERLKGILVPAGSLDVIEKVTEYIIKRTTKDDKILAIPNNAAYYFLTDRLNPTRFDLFGQIVTEGHRLEVAEDIKRERPLYVIYDTAVPPPDGIPDELQFPQALGFIKENYTLEKRFNRTLILRRIDSISPLRGRFISDRLGWKGRERNLFYAFFWNQPALYQYDIEKLDEKALFEFFYKKGISTAYLLDFYLSERLTRLSGERLIFSPPYGERLSGYAAVVDSDPAHAFVLTGDEGIDLDLILEQAGASFKKDNAGGFTIYHSIKLYPYSFEAVSSEGWKASSSHNHESTGRAFDRDVNTRWVTGKNQEPGMWYQLDMGKIYEISRISVIHGSFLPDIPRGYMISVSTDGASWNKIGENMSFKGISAYMDDRILRLNPSGIIDIVFPAMKARYIKIIQQGSDFLYNWSISEIFVFRRESDSPDRKAGDLDDLYKLAGHDVESKRYDLTLKRFYEIISRYPNYYPAHRALNTIFMRIGLPPDSSLYEKGRFFEKRGMWNSAFLEYERAIKESYRGYTSEIIEDLLRISMNLKDDMRVSLYSERLRKDFTPQKVIGANFDGKIEFLGYDIDPQVIKAGGKLRITYYWRCLKEIKKDYAIFVHILKDGKVVFQNDHYPLDKARMTSQWKQGEMIKETYDIEVPVNIERGIYIIQLGVWEPLKGKRLKVIGTGRQDSADSIRIGEIIIG